MRNPFIFGKVVTGNDFLNREKERRILVDNILSSQNTLIYSERRVGKTSLIFQSAEDAKKQAKVCLLYIDVSECESFEDLLKKISQEISFNIYLQTGSIEKCLKRLSSLFKAVRPRIELDHEGKPSFTFYFDKPEKKISDDILNAIIQLNQKQETLVVVFDEFQEIKNFKQENVESILRAKIQHHHGICYIFSGSQKRILMDIFEKESNPFYKSCFVLGIRNIEMEEWFNFIRKKFKRSGKSITDSALSNILEFCQTANSIQKLCHMCWTLSDNRADSKVVQQAIEEIINYEQEKYEVLYGRLTNFQKKVLLSLIAEPQAQIYSTSHIKKYDLGNQASIQRAIKRLIRDEIIEREAGRIKFLDKFFEYWLKAKLQFS